MQVSLQSPIFGCSRPSFLSSASARAGLARSNTICRICFTAYLLISYDVATAKVYVRRCWKMQRMTWRTTGEPGATQSRRRDLPFCASCGTHNTQYCSASHFACLRLNFVPTYHATNHCGKPTLRRHGINCARSSPPHRYSCHV